MTEIDPRLCGLPERIELGFTPDGQCVTMTVTWPCVWVSADGHRKVTANSDGTWRWPIRLPLPDSYPWWWLAHPIHAVERREVEGVPDAK